MRAGPGCALHTLHACRITGTQQMVIEEVNMEVPDQAWTGPNSLPFASRHFEVGLSHRLLAARGQGSRLSNSIHFYILSE